MRETVSALLESGELDLFIGYKATDGHCLPHCFTRENLAELDDAVIGTERYPLEKIAAHLAAVHPEAVIGIVARDCNQRALNVLTVLNQIRPGQVKGIGVNCCPSELRAHAACSYLEPVRAGDVKKQVGVDGTAPLAELEALPGPERLSRWMYEFQKCIKCYGCRDVCPVCFCADCALDHEALIGTGRLPHEAPIFHLVRAVHMAGRCVDCGLCEEACPADIPLRLLYRKVNAIVTELFGYRTGSDPGQAPLSVLGEGVSLNPLPLKKTG